MSRKSKMQHRMATALSGNILPNIYIIFVTGYEKRAHFAHYVNCQYRAKSVNRIYFRQISIIASYVSTMFTLSSGQVSDQESFPRLRTRPEHLNVSRMLSMHGVDRKCNTDVIR